MVARSGEKKRQVQQTDLSRFSVSGFQDGLKILELKQLQCVHQLQLDWGNPWYSINVGLAIKTIPINILNETFLHHEMNLRPSTFSQRLALCTIGYLRNQTGHRK